jgi:guanidinopropionase
MRRVCHERHPFPFKPRREGCPIGRVGGLTRREALAILRALKGRNIIAGDVVEVAPQYDGTSNTAHCGAQMLFTILCLAAETRMRGRL